MPTGHYILGNIETVVVELVLAQFSLFSTTKFIFIISYFIFNSFDLRLVNNVYRFRKCKKLAHFPSIEYQMRMQHHHGNTKSCNLVDQGSSQVRLDSDDLDRAGPFCMTKIFHKVHK